MQKSIDEFISSGNHVGFGCPIDSLKVAMEIRYFVDRLYSLPACVIPFPLVRALVQIPNCHWTIAHRFLIGAHNVLCLLTHFLGRLGTRVFKPIAICASTLVSSFSHNSLAMTGPVECSGTH